jgi:endonuclease/exonuclease/phosphatase family metal-dependent hydrolase
MRAMKIKVLSWNIWRGKNFPEVIEFLKKEQPDLIGLQEVLEDEEHTEKLAKELGFYYFFGKAFTTDRHETVFTLGNAVLSRFPILESRIIMLSGLEDYQRSSATEPRNVTLIKVRVKDQELTFATTHLAHSLDNVPSELRTKQTKNLMKEVDKESLILCGDFNSLPDDPAIKLLEESLINTDSDPSKKTWVDKDGDHFRIDYILTSKDLKNNTFQVLESDASDHKPISVDIELH